MKNSKPCPKCQSDEIIKINGSFGIYGAGNNIPINLGAILVTRYICTKCGFVEEWIDSENDIIKLKDKFKK